MKSNYTNKKLIGIYRQLLLPRMIEEKMLLLLRQGKISKWFSGIGQEAISVGATNALDENDYIFPMHRNLGVFTSRDVNTKKLFCQLMGKEGGFTNGRDRSFHFGLLDYNIVGMISHLAAMLPVACGIAYAKKIKKSKNIALAFVGDGATSEGDFHEALNLAAVWKLPVIFLIENNGYALSTPTSEQYACKRLSDRGIGYGIEAMNIDGNNVIEVYESILNAAKLCRQKKGPVLIEANTFRMRGHEEASGVKYVPKTLIEKWKKRDPITQFEKNLIDKKIITDKSISNIKEELQKTFEKDIEFALKAKEQKSTESKEINDVYAKKIIVKYSKSKESSQRRFVDAISDTIEQKMQSDSSVMMMGQDVAEYGGVFKISKDLLKKYGKDRIKNTPVMESAVVGAAMGLSLEGFKPIVEMQFADFASCGYNQIVNNLAKTNYRWGSPVNVTIRMPSGGGMGAGPFHSQNNENWFTQIPGLKVVYPSNPYDAKGLLTSSIDDPNPVLFFEHKGLYRSTKSTVPNQLYTVDIGKAKIIKEGSGLSIISYGLGIHWIEESIKQMPDDIQSIIEIIDLRTLIPWDQKLVLESIRKTGRAMVIHEASQTAGFGSEIAATISEKAFEYLDAPIARIGSLDIPTPFSPYIEKNIFWKKNTISKKILDLINY